MVRNACPKACQVCEDPSDVKSKMPSTLPTSVPTTIESERPSTITTIEPTHHCHNSDSYRYNRLSNQSCTWIRTNEDRRLSLCEIDEVVRECPITCGTCCEDNPHYTFSVESNNMNCAWLSTEVRIKKYCGDRMVRDGCPKSCDFCEGPSEPTTTKLPSFSPSSDPSIILSLTPTSKPITGDGHCHNSDSYRYEDDDKKSCRWIGYKQDRRTNYCKYDEVLNNCPISCRTCCEDNPHYTFYVKSELVGCSWVSNQPRHPDHEEGDFCDRFKNGRMVRDACPKACQVCEDPSDVQSKMPSMLAN